MLFSIFSFISFLLFLYVVWSEISQTDKITWWMFILLGHVIPGLLSALFSEKNHGAKHKKNKEVWWCFIRCGRCCILTYLLPEINLRVLCWAFLLACFGDLSHINKQYCKIKFSNIIRSVEFWIDSTALFSLFLWHIFI